MKKWERFTRPEIERIVQESYSIAGLAEKLGYSKCGGSGIASVKEMLRVLNIDTSHFTGQGWLVNQTYESKNYVSFEDYIKNGNAQSNKIRKKLLREGLKKHICERCQNTLWLGELIPLQVHHIDGDKTNNSLINLQLLCPNCHTFTDNYKGKNMQKHKFKNLLQEHHEGNLLSEWLLNGEDSENAVLN
jgi:RNase P subunit RPR2